MTDTDSAEFPEESLFNEQLGLTWISWVEGEAVAELDVRPMHLNRSGTLHGGVICTLLDSVCSRSGSWSPPDRPKVRSSTVSLTVNFMRATKGGTIRATGRLMRGAGSQIYSAVGEVTDADGRQLAIAQGTFKYRPGHSPKDAMG